MRLCTLTLCVLGVACAALPATGADPVAPPTLTWRLGVSDLALYDVARVTVKDGKEELGKADPLCVFGHDLRDGGQYAPVTPYRFDLPAILGLRLPAPSATSLADVSFRISLRDVLDLSFKGTCSTRVREDGAAEAVWTLTFLSKGNPDVEDVGDVREGTAEVRTTFDLARRVPLASRVHLACALRRWVFPKGEKATVRVDETIDLHLKDVRRARPDDFQHRVDAAIDRGLAFLRKKQETEGSYPSFQSWHLGTTALCALTLAECGVPRDDPAVEKALAWMVAQNVPEKTYEQGLSLMALERAYTPVSEEALLKSGRIKERRRDLPPDRRVWCEKTANRLLLGVASPGSWGYPPPPNWLIQFDTSNTQYGALGLRAASRLSIPVSETMWIGLARHFEVVRERKGTPGTVSLVHEGEKAEPGTPSAVKVPEVAGFLYSTRDASVWGSMVCGGIACLELARHELARSKSRKLTPTVAADLEAKIVSAWAWLDRHWGVDRNPEKPGNDWHLYYLYSLERAGVFSRVRTVGGKDWYYEGAEQLVASQEKDGSWKEPGANETVGTCFALLFLKRATAPLTGDDGK